GTVHVAGDTTFGTYVLPRAVAGFQTESPRVRVQMSVTRGRSVRERLLRRDADLGITGDAWEDDRFASVPLIDNELRCYCAPSHPLSRRRVRIEDLSRRVLLARTSRPGAVDSIERLFLERNVNLDPAMVIEDNEARKRAAIEGLGVAVLSTYAVRAEVDAGLLVTLDAEGFPLRRTWHSVWLRQLKLAPAPEAFRRYLCAGAWLHQVDAGPTAGP
ncbi:MAG: LysR substrate-binding domain-containing protein, partial [Candidatus Dormibacteraeota bacterium]|nr:LysR substrate-binding domain-containing protein [Candidatus Dormibacteraeota bacterium]